MQAALAHNLLSSVLALSLQSDLENDETAFKAFLAQQSALTQALERHNVFGLVTDGKALTKWQSRLLALMDGSCSAQRVGWELMLTTIRHSPFERLEALAAKLLERVVKLLKQQQQSSKIENEDTVRATSSACGVAQVLLLHVERYSPDTRREVQELLGKLLQPLVALLSIQQQTSNSYLSNALLNLIAALLRSSPNSLRSYAVKIESACVASLFSCADVNNNGKKIMADKATVCLALLSNVSDNPPQLWLQMTQKALESAHQQLDLFAGKRSSSSIHSSEGVMGKKLWVQGGATQQLPLYQRAEATVGRMNCALKALWELLSARTATQSRGHISEREVQQMLPDSILFAQRALGIRAHEVGKHTGVSEDGERLPICVIYAVMPRIYALALRTLSLVVERAGICALRHANKISRVLLLASECVGDGEDLQALANATALCARRMGASTVEKLGIPLLNELIRRSQRSLEEKRTQNDEATMLAARDNEVKSTGSKSKKRKRQALAAATLAALNESKTVGGPTKMVSLCDEKAGALTLRTILTAIATCVSVYGSLLPRDCRSLVNELTLKAVECRDSVRSSHTDGTIDPVTLALLSSTVTADNTSSHGRNLLCGIQYWQRRVAGTGGVSLALELVALNAGEAILHPRAPPMTSNLEESAKNDEKTNGYSKERSYSTRSITLTGKALDWDEKESHESGNEEAENEERVVGETNESEMPNDGTVLEEEEEKEEEEEEEDYDDSHVPNASAEVSTADIKMNEAEDTIQIDAEVDVPAVQPSMDKKLPVATVEEEEDDEFPDIVMDDD